MKQSVGMPETHVASLHRSVTKWAWQAGMFLRGERAFLLFFFLLSILLVDFSSKITTMNQGDYARTIGFMLGAPLDVVPYDGRHLPAFVWPYLPHVPNPFTESNSASVYFWLLAKIQGIIELNFNLYVVGFLSKVIVLICCVRTALIWKAHRLPKQGRFLVLTAFALAFFYSHNVEFLNSLYAEHPFIAGMAIVLAGAVEPRRTLRIVLLSAGLLLAAASKPQFFYLPLLFIACLTGISLLQRKRPDGVLLLMLATIQGISLLTLLNASTKQTNYYHSLYFGSYTVLTPEERRSANIPEGTLDCVGVDWWGWKMVGEQSTHVVPAPKPCTLPKAPFTLAQVLAPYFHHPFLLMRLAMWSLPDQFTVHYFELAPTTPYMRPSNGTSYRNGSTLILASNLREAIVTRFWILIVLAGIVLPFLPGSQPIELHGMTLFLSLAVPTQIAACLLGEGVRDLSKHLAGAQLCLDLLSMICLLHALSFFVSRISSRESSALATSSS